MGWPTLLATIPLSDGRSLLATGDSGGTIRLWDPTTTRPVGDP